LTTHNQRIPTVRIGYYYVRTSVHGFTDLMITIYIVLVISEFLHIALKHRCGNQLIHRWLFQKESVISGGSCG